MQLLELASSSSLVVVVVVHWAHNLWKLVPVSKLVQPVHTPWYPSMTLYRQPVSDDWHSVFQRVQADLQRFVTQNLDTKNIYDA